MSVRNSFLSFFVFCIISSWSVLGLSFYEGPVSVQEYTVAGTVQNDVVQYTGTYTFRSENATSVALSFPSIPADSVRTSSGVFSGELIFTEAGTQELLFTYTLPLSGSTGSVVSEVLFDAQPSATPFGTLSMRVQGEGVRLSSPDGMEGTDQVLTFVRSHWYPETLRFTVAPVDERLVVTRSVSTPMTVNDSLTVTYTLTNEGSAALSDLVLAERVLATYFTSFDTRFTLSDAQFEPAYVAQLSVPALASGASATVSYELRVRSVTGAYLLPARVLSGTRVLASVPREDIVLAGGPTPTPDLYPPQDTSDNEFSLGEQVMGREYVSVEDAGSWIWWASGIVLILFLLYVFRERLRARMSSGGAYA